MQSGVKSQLGVLSQRHFLKPEVGKLRNLLVKQDLVLFDHRLDVILVEFKGVCFTLGAVDRFVRFGEVRLERGFKLEDLV